MNSVTSRQEVPGSKRFSGVISAGRNSAYLLSIQFVSILIRLAYLFVLARSVTPASYGVLTYALSWYLVFLPFTYLGADVVLSREIAKRRDDAPALLGMTLGCRLIAIPLLFAISLGSAAALERDPDIQSMVFLFSFALVGRSLWMWSAAAFTAFEESRLIARFEVAIRLLEVGALLLILRFVGPDLHSIAVIHAASWLLQGAAAAFAIWRRYGLSLSRPNTRWLAVVRDGLPGAAFAIAMAAFFQLPIVLYRQIQGVGDELGYFGLAFQIVTYLLTFPYLVANASLPVLSRSTARKDGKDRKAVLVLVPVIFFGGAAVGLTAKMLATPIVVWLFGVDYSPASIALATGLWLLIPASLAILFQQLLFSNSVRTRLTTAGPLIGVAAMSILFPLLAQADEYSGSLLAVACGFWTWLLFAFIETVRWDPLESTCRHASLSIL